MSILLEALRKSEKDRHKVRPPDIHAGDFPEPANKLPRRGLVVVLLIMVLLALGWFLYEHYRAQGATPQLSNPVAAESTQSTGSEEKQPMLAKTDKSQAGANDTAGKGSKAKTRTPVEILHKGTGANAESPAEKVSAAKSRPTPYIISTPAKVAANSNSKKTASGKATSNKPAAEKKVASTPVSKKAGNKKTSSQKPADKKQASKSAVAKAKNTVSAKAKNTRPAAEKPAKAKPQKESNKEFRPDPPAPISYWELPDAIRASVPEIKFSVLVYANDPSDRFALIDGVRLAEGDRHSSGILVKEIRRDGVIFKYRLYEFLVER